MQASARAAGGRALAPLQRSSGTARPRRAALAPARALFGGGGKDGGKDGGGLMGMGNLMENIKKAQVLVQEQAAKVQEELAAAEFEGFSSDETVRVVMSGNQEPRGVDVTEEAHAQGAEKVSELVYEAMRDAHAKSVEGMKARMQTLAQSLGLPKPPSM